MAKKPTRKQQMQNAARARHAKFKQTRVQTFGGKKTSFSNAEKKRITDAGYSVKGYSKAAPKSNTSVQISKDNARYGNTVPSGSFGISAAGRAQAEKNKAEAAAKKEATRKSMFDSSRLFGNYNAQIGGKFATTLADTFAKPKYMYQGNMAGRLPGLSNYFTPDVGTGLPYTKGGSFRGIPFTGGDKTGSLTKFKVPDGAKLSRSPLGVRQYKLNPSQMKNLGMGLTDDASKFAAKGLSKYGARAIPFVGAVPSLIDAGVRFKNKDYMGAGLSTLSAVPGKIGWASLAGLAAYDASKALNTGDTTKVSSTDAGGLNIGGSVDSEKTEGSKTGRTLPNRLLGGVDAVLGTDLDKLGGRTTPFGESLTSSINAFNTANQNIGELTGSTNPVKNLASSLMLGKNVSMEDLAATTEAAKTFKDEGLTEGLKSLNPQTTQSIGDVYNALEAGRLADPRTGTDVYKQAMTNFGGESFRSKINEGVNYFTEKYGQLTDNEKENRKVVSEMLTAKDPRLDSLKALGYQMKENPKLGIQEQVKNALKPNAPQLPGANKEDLGIVGSIGNFILSNQGKSIVTGNLPGTNNALDLASNIVKTGSDPTSDTYKKSQAFLRTIGAGTPTPGSIIRGVIPRLGRSRGGTPVGQVRSGGSLPSVAAAALQQQQQPVEELPLPTNADRPNLASIMQNAYNNQLSTYGVPNYMAQFQPTQSIRPLRRRQYFNRDYFTQFA